MARRKTLNRKRNSDRKSIDSIGSGLLDSDTSVLDEEQTFWWNHLQEKTFPSHSLIQNKNETARQLNDSSRVNPTPGPSEWWKNLDRSGSEHGASTSSKRNLSAVMIKSNILQTSTSESEKEDLRKKKVHLKGTNNRKSTNNAFSRALDDTEVTVPLKLQKKKTNYSDSHSDLDREVSQKRLQEDEEDNPSLTENILKSKPSISRRRKDKNAKDQNLFQDILMEDDVLNDNTTRRSIALQKESSKHSMHRDIGTSKAHTDDQRKSMRASQAIESRETDSPNLLAPNAAVPVSNINESAQSSEESETKISYNKYLKLNSHFMQRVRKSMGKNAFADALADDGGASLSTFNPNNENDTRKSPLTTRSSSSLSKRSINRSKTKDITHENSPIYRSPRSSLNAAKKQSLDVQAQDNIEADLSNSSLDDNESRGKRSIFLKPKSRKSLRKSVTKNLYEEIFEEESNISARKSNASIKDSHASFERDKTIRVGQVRSLTLEKSSQSKSNKTMNAEDSSDISTTLSSGEKDVSEKSNVFVGNKSKLLEKSGLTNASKSSSQKTNTSVVPETSEKEASSSRKSTREETLKEHANVILTDGSTSSNEIVIHENISDDSHDDIDVEHDSSMPKRMSESNSVKEARLTRNNLRNRSETPKRANIEIHKVDSRNDANMEHDSSMLKRVSETNSAKEARLTRNSLRNRSETPKRANIEIHKVDNSRNDANMEHDSSMFKRVSETNSAKEARLTRNSLRNRSETPKRANIGIHKVIDNSRNDANMEHDSSMSERVSKSSLEKEARLTHNSLRNRSETPQSANIVVHKVIDDPRNDTNKEHDSSMSKRISKSSPAKETRVMRNSLRNRSETPAKDMELSKRSTNWIADVEEDNANAELNVDISRVNSTRISKVNATVGTRKSTILSAEMETTDDEDADSGMQIEQNSTLTKATGTRGVSRQSVQSTSKTSIKEGKETSDRQRSLGKSQNYRNTPIKASGKDISSKDISSKAGPSKVNLSKSLRKIDDFFKVKQSSTDKQPNEHVQKSQFDTEKMEKIKTELERIKNREMAAMKIATDKKESALKTKNVLPIMLKKAPKKKRLANLTKVVDKAFLVDGEIYKAPRLPRPKYWATDRLYKFLWKHMEPKYKLATRLKSEKFVQELAKIITFIQRRKNYENYKSEIEALMKEMARLKIINTRNDFYHFCQDFLPYEFRVKVVPMLMPGNKMNIPYDPEKLHIPLLDT